MKKRRPFSFILLGIVVLVAAYGVVGTGFMARHDVYLADYSLSPDGKEITMQIGVATAMGFVRTYQDDGGGVKPHYLTFYTTFGGLNSRLGAKNTFVLPLEEADREIWFSRPDNGYELMLVKGEDGLWARPQK